MVLAGHPRSSRLDRCASSRPMSSAMVICAPSWRGTMAAPSRPSPSARRRASWGKLSLAHRATAACGSRAVQRSTIGAADPPLNCIWKMPPGPIERSGRFPAPKGLTAASSPPKAALASQRRPSGSACGPFV